MATHKPEILIFQLVYNMQAAKIPTATLIFPKWINSMKLFPILCKASRSRKSKMAAHKHRKLICQLVYNVAGQFQKATDMYFPGWKIPLGGFPYCVTQAKELISRPVYNIPVQFRQLYPCFQGLEMQRNYSLSCVMQSECRMQAAFLDFWLSLHHTM